MTQKTPYDIVIIGGGITGAGIARDAALRGLRVALFEKNDFASGTSSKSSKLIHGGLRYLEQAEIGLVFESVSERRVQMHMAPHLVRPMSFLLPVFDDGPVGLELMNVGLWIYDTLALFRSPKLHDTIRGAEKVAKIAPQIRTDGIQGAIEYHDCFTDDSRLVLENIIAAQEAGSRCESYAEVLEIQRKDDRVSAVRVRNSIDGTEEVVETACVIMATGPWSDKAIGQLGAGMNTPLLSPTKGVHLVVPHEKLPLKRAMTVMSPVDGRVMFAIPWRERMVIGTTDTYFDGNPDQVHADKNDIDYLCKSANLLFPRANLSADDVISTWAGLRPLIHEEAASASEVSREHQVYVNDDGVLLIAGGKLTTYRIMAKDTVKAAIAWIREAKEDYFDDRKLVRPRTKKRPLPGGKGFRKPGPAAVKKLGKKLAKSSGLSPKLTEHWAFTYGSRAHKLVKLVKLDAKLLEPLQEDLIYTWAEVEYAIGNENVKTVDDVLSRRVPLLLIGREQGLDVAPQVADCMATAFGWSDARKAEEVERYNTTVANSRLFR